MKFNFQNGRTEIQSNAVKGGLAPKNINLINQVKVMYNNSRYLVRIVGCEGFEGLE